LTSLSLIAVTIPTLKADLAAAAMLVFFAKKVLQKRTRLTRFWV
jgi:hypothetical protein